MAIRFRKKPVIVEAVRWTGENLAELSNFARDKNGASMLGIPNADESLQIRTLEDGKGVTQVEHVANKGDWIVKGLHGEFYAVKPDIFEATYERA